MSKENADRNIERLHNIDISSKTPKTYRKWSDDETALLLQAIRKHRKANGTYDWKKLKADADIEIDRTIPQMQDRLSTLRSTRDRVAQIMEQLACLDIDTLISAVGQGCGKWSIADGVECLKNFELWELDWSYMACVRLQMESQVQKLAGHGSALSNTRDFEAGRNLVSRSARKDDGRPAGARHPSQDQNRDEKQLSESEMIAEFSSCPEIEHVNAQDACSQIEGVVGPITFLNSDPVPPTQRIADSAIVLDESQLETNGGTLCADIFVGVAREAQSCCPHTRKRACGQHRWSPTNHLGQMRSANSLEGEVNRVACLCRSEITVSEQVTDGVNAVECSSGSSLVEKCWQDTSESLHSPVRCREEEGLEPPKVEVMGVVSSGGLASASKYRKWSQIETAQLLRGVKQHQRRGGGVDWRGLLEAEGVWVTNGRTVSQLRERLATLRCARDRLARDLEKLCSEELKDIGTLVGCCDGTALGRWRVERGIAELRTSEVWELDWMYIEALRREVELRLRGRGQHQEGAAVNLSCDRRQIVLNRDAPPITETWKHSNDTISGETTSNGFSYAELESGVEVLAQIECEGCDKQHNFLAPAKNDPDISPSIVPINPLDHCFMEFMEEHSNNEMSIGRHLHPCVPDESHQNFWNHPIDASLDRPPEIEALCSTFGNIGLGLQEQDFNDLANSEGCRDEDSDVVYFGNDVNERFDMAVTQEHWSVRKNLCEVFFEPLFACKQMTDVEYDISGLSPSLNSQGFHSAEPHCGETAAELEGDSPSRYSTAAEYHQLYSSTPQLDFDAGLESKETRSCPAERRRARRRWTASETRALQLGVSHYQAPGGQIHWKALHADASLRPWLAMRSIAQLQDRFATLRNFRDRLATDLDRLDEHQLMNMSTRVECGRVGSRDLQEGPVALREADITALDLEYLGRVREDLDDFKFSEAFRTRWAGRPLAEAVTAELSERRSRAQQFTKASSTAANEGLEHRSEAACEHAVRHTAKQNESTSTSSEVHKTQAAESSESDDGDDQCGECDVSNRAFYCGFIHDLVEHAGDRRMTTRQVRRWLEDHPGLCPFPAAALASLEVDHYIPRARGGHDHPYNYFLMPRAANRGFGKDLTAAKAAFVGRRAARCADAFARAMRDQSLPSIDYSLFRLVDAGLL